MHVGCQPLPSILECLLSCDLFCFTQHAYYLWHRGMFSFGFRKYNLPLMLCRRIGTVSCLIALVGLLFSLLAIWTSFMCVSCLFSIQIRVFAAVPIMLRELDASHLASYRRLHSPYPDTVNRFISFSFHPDEPVLFHMLTNIRRCHGLIAFVVRVWSMPVVWYVIRADEMNFRWILLRMYFVSRGTVHQAHSGGSGLC